MLRVGETDPVLLSSKAQALVAFLILQAGRPVRRKIVGEMLWPDRSAQRARNSLKQELYLLQRDAFRDKDVIATKDGAISITPGRVACDVHELLTLFNRGIEAPWREISQIYAGPLLNSFPSVSVEFDDFLIGMRRALEADMLNVLGNLADNTGNGRSGECVAIAERMLAIDPLREDVHRRLIRGYADAGRRVDAMRVHADARALLRRDLDVAPAAESENLFRRIHDGY